MDTVIEAQRKLLEERERVEDALVQEKMLRKTNVCAYTTTSIRSVLVYSITYTPTISRSCVRVSRFVI